MEEDALGDKAPETPKKPSAKGRARATRLIKRATKKIVALAAEITDQDVAVAIDRLRKQLNATKGMWDVGKRCIVQIPDEKIRFDAAVMILAYRWGKPVERSVTANVDPANFEAMVAKYAHLQERKQIEDQDGETTR